MVTTIAPDHTQPPVTIVTPVYNGGRYIAETVESVLAQDHPGLEHIVVDDGSTDDTGARLKAYRDRVRVVSQANMGEAAAVNRGVALATHDIVAVVNADDPVMPGLASAAAEALASDPALVAVYPDWVKIDAEGRALEVVETLDFDYRVLVTQHFCIPGPGAFFRRSRLEGEPFRDPAAGLSGDYDFWLRLGLRGPIRRIPRPLATWREHGAGLSQAGCNADMARVRIEVVERYFRRDDLTAEVRALRTQALSAAYFSAGMLGLRGRDIPARRYLLRSYLAKPLWPASTLPQQRRSLPHVAYLLAQPLSGLVHRAIGPSLPAHLRHEAMLRKRFNKPSDA